MKTEVIPRLSVVVATRDRPELLDECLEAIKATSSDSDEVIVVDSCSSGTASAAVAAAHGTTVLRCDEPGASRARNLGWRAARHGAVAFIDDDVRVANGWACSLRRVLTEHPETSFVTGRLGLRPEDYLAERPVAFFDQADGFVIDRRVVDKLGHGANLTVRREALEKVGGFDEQLGPGARWHAAEDLDLIDRLLSSGSTGRYEPSVEAVHVQWRRKLDLLRLEWHYGIGQGARLAKLRGHDRERYDAVASITWREQGLSTLLRCVREHYEFGAVSALIRLAATAQGDLTARLARTSWSANDEQ